MAMTDLGIDLENSTSYIQSLILGHYFMCGDEYYPLYTWNKSTVATIEV